MPKKPKPRPPRTPKRKAATRQVSKATKRKAVAFWLAIANEQIRG